MKFQAALAAILSTAFVAHAAPVENGRETGTTSLRDDSKLQARQVMTEEEIRESIERTTPFQQCDNVSHFIDETSNDPSSPLRRDCQELLRELRRDGRQESRTTSGTLSLDRGGFILGWSEGTNCAIGARRLDTGHIVSFGRDDAIDLLDDALSREDFGRNNRIGVRGELSCNIPVSTSGATAQVQFSISHADDW